MEVIFTIAAIFAVVLILLKLVKQSNNATSCDASKQVEREEDYKIMNINGLNYRGLNDRFIGEFKGYLLAETDNEHDEFAVAVYNSDNVHLGYTNAGYATFHSYILSVGGKLDIEGIIKKGKDGQKTYYYGKIAVLFGEKEKEQGKYYMNQSTTE